MIRYFFVLFSMIFGFCSTLNISLASLLEEGANNTRKTAPGIYEFINMKDNELIVYLHLHSYINDPIIYAIKLSPAHVNDMGQKIPSKKIYCFDDIQKVHYKTPDHDWLPTHEITSESTNVFLNTIEYEETGVKPKDCAVAVPFPTGLMLIPSLQETYVTRTQVFPLFCGGYHMYDINALYFNSAIRALMISKNDLKSILFEYPHEITDLIVQNLVLVLLGRDTLKDALIRFDDIKNDCLEFERN